MNWRRPDNPRATRRVNPSGRVVWIARYPTRSGRRLSAGTFALKRDAERAIAEAMDREWSYTTDDTFGDYADVWLVRHPRSERTNTTNRSRVRAVRQVEVQGYPLELWRFADLRRRHALELVDHLLREGRAATGVQNIMRTLSAMAEDAITDEVIETNPFRDVRVRANDPRIRKGRRPKRVWTWEQMHEFARACGEIHPQWEAAARVLSDCGLRVSEMLALHVVDVDFERSLLCVRRTLDVDGRVLVGTKTTQHDPDAALAGRYVPITAELRDMLWRQDHSGPFLFTGERGRPKLLRNLYRDIWWPTQERTGMDIRPHEMRHSWITHLAAARVDVADLARMAGHSVQTLNGHYRHAKQESFDRVLELVPSTSHQEGDSR